MQRRGFLGALAAAVGVGLAARELAHTRCVSWGRKWGGPWTATPADEWNEKMDRLSGKVPPGLDELYQSLKVRCSHREMK